MGIIQKIFGMNRDSTSDRTKPVIHLINPMNNPFGGSENRTAELYNQLSRSCNVYIWSEHKICQAFSRKLPIKSIHRQLGLYPKGGTIVFMGCYFKIGKWIESAQPSRVIGLYNTPDEVNLNQFLTYMRTAGLESVCEFVYASEWLRKQAGLPGVVQMSPIDLNRFKPLLDHKNQNKYFTIGRLSRDVLSKHHVDDIEIYKWFTGVGGKSRIMGGTVLKDKLGNDSMVELLPEGAIPAEVFFQSLNCFFYRTAPEWREPHGRVVTEAMACGLPVVCGGDGGYRDFIEHGINGFVFNSNSEAQSMIIALKNDREFATSVGSAARRTMEQMFSEAALSTMVDYYIGTPKTQHHIFR